MSSNRQIPVFSIYDKRTGNYGDPFVREHSGYAKRLFADMAADTGSRVHQYPDEFQLQEIGTMDMKTGKLANLEPYEYICNSANDVDLGRRKELSDGIQIQGGQP